MTELSYFWRIGAKKKGLILVSFIFSIFSFILPADSIMALYAPKTHGNQPQMYGVPGGMYIAPQQQPQQAPPNQHPAMFNRMAGVPPQGMPMGMGAPRQPAFMQPQQQQQQQASI